MPGLELGDGLGAAGVGGRVRQRAALDVEVDLGQPIRVDRLAVGRRQRVHGGAGGGQLGAGGAAEGDPDVTALGAQRADLRGHGVAGEVRDAAPLGGAAAAVGEEGEVVVLHAGRVGGAEQVEGRVEAGVDVGGEAGGGVGAASAAGGGGGRRALRGRRAVRGGGGPGGGGRGGRGPGGLRRPAARLGGRAAVRGARGVVDPAAGRVAAAVDHESDGHRRAGGQALGVPLRGLHGDVPTAHARLRRSTGEESVAPAGRSNSSVQVFSAWPVLLVTTYWAV